MFLNFAKESYILLHLNEFTFLHNGDYFVMSEFFSLKKDK